MKRLAALFIVLVAALSAQAAQLTRQDVRALSDAANTLRVLASDRSAGPWRFHWPADPGAERSDFDDSKWPQVWPEHRWDKPDSAAWYRMVVVVPQRLGRAPCPGGPLVLKVGVDDDGELYVNGRLVQKFHWDDGQVTLTDNARPGQRFVVALKVINGPGPGRLRWARLEFAALSPYRDDLSRQASRLDFVRELLETEGDVDARYLQSARAAVRALKWDLVARDPKAFARTVHESHRALRPLADLAKRYSLYLIGHAHIDMNWLWLWPETIQVCHDTWWQAVRFMDEFPQFCFSESQPAAYRAIERHHPDLFAQIQKYIQAGRWDYVGATWVQGDTNMASGEALCRQLLTAREYAMEKFGRWTKMAWLPDNFGHAWTVPTIFADAGIEWYYFARCNPGFPLFWWEGPDGSRLAAYSYGGYSWRITPRVTRVPLDVKRRVGVHEAMIAYGVGDHGGGPTRRDIEQALALQKEEIAPRILFARTDQFFESALRDKPRLPVWRSEMNFTFRGCYTTHSDMKRRNRRLENFLPTAEAAATAAWVLGGRQYDNSAFMEAWRNVCFNQFHDLLPGSAIHDSYKFCHQLYDLAQKTARRELDASLASLAKLVDTRGDGQAVLVWNRLGWLRQDFVAVPLKNTPRGPLVAVGPEGEREPVQVVDAGGAASALFRATVPSCGWAVYHLQPAQGNPSADVQISETDDAVVMENEHLRVVVEKSSGTVKSLYDKQLDRELVAIGERLGVLQILWEDPHGMSAWNIGPIRWTRFLMKAEAVRVAERGPNEVAAEVIHRWHNSTFTQRIILRAGTRRLDFDLTADWQEVGNGRNGGPMLKVAFPLRMRRAAFTCEIPFGSIERGLDGQDVPAQMWADMTEYRQRAAGRGAVTVDLSRYFNQDVFGEAGEADGGDFDYDQVAYPAEMLKGAKHGLMHWHSIPWRVPPVGRGQKNAIRCNGQTVKLPPADAGSLVVFGASAPGSSGGLAELIFSDGSRQSVALHFSDWCYGPGAGEEIVLRWPYRYRRGEKTTPEVRIFARSFGLPRGKRLVAIKLPRQAKLRIFAMTLAPRVERLAKWGVALLNDCKYGHDARGTTLRLTLLRASHDPDPVPDKGTHRIRYSLLPHEGVWSAREVVRPAWELNNPLVAVSVATHDGTLPAAGSFVELEPDNLVLAAVKKAEHADAVIVRWYEAEGHKTTATVRVGFPLARAELTNVVEAARRGRLAVRGRTVRVPTRAHSVVTVKLVPRR